MTPEVERVKAFCERSITYHRIIVKLRKQEAGALKDAEEVGEQPDKIYEHIHENKIKYTDLWATAKNQVYDLVTNSKLAGEAARVIDLRYRRGMTWEKIKNAVGYDSKQSVYNQQNKAFEQMAPTLDRLFPDWQIGDK
jgi:hypothetical protein